MHLQDFPFDCDEVEATSCTLDVCPVHCEVGDWGGWGEANPGGGQDEIARYLEKSRKEVVESANLLKVVMDLLGVPVLN